MPAPAPAVQRLRRGVVLALAAVLVAGVAPVAGALPEPPADPSSTPSQPPSPTAAPSSSATPAPTSSPTPTPTPTPSPTATAIPSVKTPPDRTDHRWPKNPPWDACPRPTWPGTLSSGEPGGGRRVLVVGDSLTRDSRKLTARGMRASGWTPTFRCWGSRRLDWGIEQVRRAKSLGQLPSFVVVALGTNDISWESQATTERRARLLLDVIGPKRQVLWVDLDVDHSAFSRSRGEWFNRMIRVVADKRANVTVIPWRRVARAASAGRFDGIHYGTYGYRLRAQTVLKRLNAAGRAHPAPTPRPTPAPTPTGTPDPLASPVPEAWAPALSPTPTPTPSSLVPEALLESSASPSPGT